MEARECARFNLQPQLPRTTAGEGNFAAKTPMCCRPTTTTIVVACPDRVSWSPESNQLLFWQITISEFWKKTAKIPPRPNRRWRGITHSKKHDFEEWDLIAEKERRKCGVAVRTEEEGIFPFYGIMSCAYSGSERRSEFAKKGEEKEEATKVYGSSFPNSRFLPRRTCNFALSLMCGGFSPPCQFWGSGTHENRIGREGGGEKEGTTKQEKGWRKRRKFPLPPFPPPPPMSQQASEHCARENATEKK